MDKPDLSKLSLDEILELYGYKAAKAEADKRGRLWFASAGAKRKPKEG